MPRVWPPSLVSGPLWTPYLKDCQTAPDSHALTRDHPNVIYKPNILYKLA